MKFGIKMSLRQLLRPFLQSHIKRYVLHIPCMCLYTLERFNILSYVTQQDVLNVVGGKSYIFILILFRQRQILSV